MNQSPESVPVPTLRPRVSPWLFAGLLLALSLPGTTSSQTNCAPSPSGLIGWWTGEGNALDRVGTNHGTLVNGAGFSEGKVGTAFNFDGSGAFVQIPDSPP